MTIEIADAVEAVWRMESARIIGGLVPLVRNLDVAEELAQDAVVAALAQWPASGIPDQPGAWLMAVARRRAVDLLRRRTVGERAAAELDRASQLSMAQDAAAADGMGLDPVDRSDEDPALRLIFIACHPVLSAEARVALTLKLVAGLTTAEVARAFLVAEATVAQRIVRAKRTLADTNVPYTLPEGAQRTARVASVLEVIYLVFNEGYAATAGDDWIRGDLCREALRLGRSLATMLPNEAEVRGLVALMELQASRLRARVGPEGEPVLLADQDRRQWDRLLIRRGLASLQRAEQLGGGVGVYRLQAAIAACHATAQTVAATDWPRVAALYDALAVVAPSPIVELNRAVAVSMAYGPADALALVDRIAEEKALVGYHLLPSVRGDLLERLGRRDEAAAEFARAASLAANARERELLLARAARVTGA